MTDENVTTEAPAAIECSATKDPSVRMFIFAAMAGGLGIYCFIDHYIKGEYKYPVPYDLNDYLTHVFNRYGPMLLIPLGLVVLIMGVAALRRKLVADQEGIGYVGKVKIPWSAIGSLDTAKFAKKGVLGLNYELEGTPGKLVLDSWKLTNFRELVALVESKVSPAEPAGEEQEGQQG